MTSSKKKSLLNRLKGACLNLLLKTMLYILGALVVLILIISAIPSLFIYLLVGNYSLGKQINKKHKIPVNHFNE